MSKNIDIAMIGSTSPIGEAILELLSDQQFPVNQLIPLAFEDDTENTIEFSGANVHIQNIAEFNFANVDLVFICQLDESYQPIVDRILDANCRLIELGSNLQNAPVVVAGENVDEQILKESQHIRSAEGVVVVLSQLLSNLNKDIGIKSIHFTSLQSVSEKGKAGINELAMQTTDLLNTRPIKPSVFKKQIAFNVISDDSEINMTGFSVNERELMEELHTVLFAGHTDSASIIPSLIHVPVFYGVCLDVHIELKQELELTDVEKFLSGSSNVEMGLIDELITPVSHAADMDKVFVNRIRQDPHNSKIINFLCITDTIKSGSAINGVQIAEILVKHHL